MNEEKIIKLKEEKLKLMAQLTPYNREQIIKKIEAINKKIGYGRQRH